MNRLADRPLLDICAHQLVALAELVDERIRLARGCVGDDEVVWSGHDVVDAVPARVHQQRGRDAAARRHAGENESFLDVLEIAWKRLDARALLRTVREHPPHLPLVETGGTGGRRSRSEHTA